MVKRASKGKRNRNTKREKNVIAIAVEGKNKTEKTYFSEFNRRNSAYRVNFVPGNYTDTLGLVVSASEYAMKNNLNYDNGDRVFAVCDVDFGKEAQINKARRLAEDKSVDLILSNPCFEIWLLLHFGFSTKGYTNNSAVVADLQRVWPEYRKNIDTFNTIEMKRMDAIRNARKLLDYYNADKSGYAIEKYNPSTDIHRIAELLV